MLMRYLKWQLMVLLCGGLVGPLFLVVYFATGQQGLLKWMFFVGLLITAADVLIALALANYSAKSQAKTEALEQSGMLALAQIRGLAETGTRINDRPVVRLSLHIAGPGFEFDSEKRAIVDISKQAIVTSRKLVVLVDPNTHDYEIDWQRSALVSGVVPAQFTSTEDHKTYDLSGQPGPLMEIMQIYKANNIPVSGKVDVRSNPAVRSQVQAIVRRAAAQHAPAAQPAPTAAAPVAAASFLAPPGPSIAQRLQELETLRAAGAVSAAEYAAKRQQIISEI